jgi:hypothetical protein
VIFVTYNTPDLVFSIGVPFGRVSFICGVTENRFRAYSLHALSIAAIAIRTVFTPRICPFILILYAALAFAFNTSVRTTTFAIITANAHTILARTSVGTGGFITTLASFVRAPIAILANGGA